MLMKLHHENIVPFYGVYQHVHFDAGSSQPLDRFFFVSEFADHGSLDQHIAEDPAVGASLSCRLQWVLQIGGAIEYIHKNEIVHRDLKPQNVLVHGDDKQCLVRDFEHLYNSPRHQHFATCHISQLTDFGASRSLCTPKSLTVCDTGTLRFMPPEVLASQGHAERLSGTWAEAFPDRDTLQRDLVFYSLAVGQLSFRRHTELQPSFAVKHESCESLGHVRGACSNQLLLMNQFYRVVHYLDTALGVSYHRYSTVWKDRIHISIKAQ